MTEHEPKSNSPDDRELEEFLAGRSPVSRAYKESAQDQAAPPELDAPVLAAAREAMRRSRPARRLLRWDSPLALAASMFLVLGLGWLVQLQMPRPGAGHEAAVSAPAPVLDERDAAKAMTRAGAAQPLANAPAAAPKEPGAGAGQSELRKEAPAREKKGPAPPPKLAAPAIVTSAPAVTPDTVAEPMAAAAPPTPAPAPVAPVENPATTAAEQPRDRLQQKPEETESANLAAAAPAPPAPPAQPPAAKALADKRPEGGTRYAAPAMPTDSLGAAPSAQGRVQADACDSPQRLPAQRRAQPEVKLDAPAWLEQIRGLRGDSAAARVELACFRSRYPQFEVPEDLKSLPPP